MTPLLRIAPLLLAALALTPFASPAQETKPPATASPAPATAPLAQPAEIAPPKPLTTGWGDRLKDAGSTGLVQLGLSLFGASFIFERLFHLRRKHINPEGLAQTARTLWSSGKFSELEQLGETHPSTLARTISFITKNRTAPMVEVSSISGDLISREIGAHYQRAYPLGIVATLAPLLGLLGMILGMIETFETVAYAGALGDPSQLASGISEALVTTGLGLAIAIPFLALYHYFKHRTTGYGAELEEEVTSLLTDWLIKK